MKQKLTREIHPEIRIIDADAGIVDYIASDETLDCYNEIIQAAGWRFDLFQKNAPFVDSHDYSSITKLLGKVVSFGVQGKQLVERVQYSLQPDTLAQWAFAMVRDGFLKAVSVGFFPVRMVSKWDPSKADFLAAVSALGLSAELAAQVNAIYLEQQQIELSQCVIGANPNALAKAYKAGCLSEKDIDNFAAMIARTKTAPSAASRADAEGASRRAKLAILAQIQAQLS
jgi:hypothetical protein